MQIGRALSITAALALSACATMPPMTPREAQQNPAQYDLQHEFDVLGGTNQPGQLAEVTPGKDSSTTEILVHGIGSGPDSLLGLTPQAIASGHKVEVFLYDTVYRKLSDSSRDLANDIVAYHQAYPSTKIELVTHSMGGRMGLDAVRQLSERGQLPPGLDMKMVAPTLEGFVMANTAFAAPDFIAAKIPRTLPGKDMATLSSFQRNLDAMHLTSVPITIYAGDHDNVADYSNPRFQRIAENVHARMIYVRDADHDSILTKAADDEQQYFTAEALPHH